MPTLVRLDTCKLTVYAGDHNPPHFHVMANDGKEALVEIATLSVIQGTVKAATMREALAWAVTNRAAINAKWKALNQ